MLDKDRLKQQEEASGKRYMKNFYVLDTETSGLKHNELIHVAVIRYENGKEAENYQRLYMPEKAITEEAKRVNGWTKKKL